MKAGLIPGRPAEERPNTSRAIASLSYGGKTQTSVTVRLALETEVHDGNKLRIPGNVLSETLDVKVDEITYNIDVV